MQDQRLAEHAEFCQQWLNEMTEFLTAPGPLQITATVAR